ncbi:MAG: GFA family protein [Sandaracinus sp.]
MTRHARCSCGQLSLEADGEPVRISVCHCLECQRRTGSVFGAQARFPASAVRVRGASTSYTRKTDSGGELTSQFCPHCGTTVYYRVSRLPGFVGVALGAFADPTFPAPRFEVYTDRKHAWVEVLGDLDRQA